MPTPPPSSFNGFDWFLLLVLAVSTLLAFMRGIIKVLLSLGGLVLGIVAAAWYYRGLAHGLSNVISSFAVAQVVAFLLIAVGIMIVFTVVANLLRRTAKVIGLGFFDRLLGGAFGFVRGCLLGSAAMMAAVAFLPDSAWIRTSQLAPYFLAGAHAVSFIVPETFQQQVAAGGRRLLEQAPELMRARTLTQPKDE